MSEEEPAGFLIDGQEYPIVSHWDFDADEDQILWDYARIAKVDFVPVDSNEKDAERLEAERLERLRHPGLNRTYLHVTYRRGNPHVSESEIKKLISKTKMPEVMSLIIGQEPEDDAGPPDQSVMTSNPGESSPSEQSLTDNSAKPKPDSSTNGSPNGSDEPASHPETIGTGRSDTSSPESALTT